jgi:hypothetical protein
VDLTREGGPAVADPVALGERSVEQNVIRIGLPKDPQQSGCPVGQVWEAAPKDGFHMLRHTYA